MNGPAETAGFKANDKILTIDDLPITRYEDVLKTTKSLPVKELTFKINRGGNEKIIKITPQDVSYINDKGVQKSHGRLGVLARHTPYKFNVLKEIEGKDVSNLNNEEIKNILLKYTDKNIIVGLKSVDKNIHSYRTHLSKELNKKLFISNDDNNIDSFILGKIGNNFYKDLSLNESMKASISQSFFMFKVILKSPLQIFPIDTENLSPKSIVTQDGFNFIAKLYKLIFIVSFVSIVIGLINLLPIAYFDGGRIFILLVEFFTPIQMTRKRVAFTTFITLLIFYVAISSVNYTKFPIYINHLTEKYLPN